MKTTYTKLISAFLILAALSVTSCKKKPELPLKMKIENEILNCNYEKIETLFKENEPLSEEELRELAEFAFRRKVDFKSIQSICENGLSVNTRILDEKYLISLLELAVQYRQEDFVNYIIKKGITKESLYTDKDYDLLIKIVKSYHGDYFCEILNSFSPELLEQIKLVDLLESLYNQKKQKNIDCFYSNKKIIELLQQDEELVYLIVRNYSSSMVEDLRNHFDFKKLNFNGTFALEYAISDHNLEAIKMLFDHGVSPEIRLDWKDEENLSIIEYAHCEFKLRRMMCTSKEEYDQTAKEGKIFIDELEKLLKRYR